MVFSMTGFAKISQNIEGVEHTFEIKTLNHKYVDIKLTLPRTLECYEAAITELLRNEIKRGSVRCNYTIKNINSSVTKFDVDIDLAKSYHEAYAMVSKTLKVNYVPDISVIMRLNGVMNVVEDGTVCDEDVVLKVVSKAVAELNNYRITEGSRLSKFIADRLKYLKKLIAQISKFASSVKEIYYNRIKEKITEFKKKTGVEITDDRIWQEVALLADRSDISEEVERFQTHLKYFDNLLAGKEKDPIIGRKLDFMCQELFREITTISNKTNLTDITKIAIEVKSEVEKIREQVQNIQ